MTDRLTLPHGTLELLNLKALALEPLHGWALPSDFSKSPATRSNSRRAHSIPLCTGSSAGA